MGEKKETELETSDSRHIDDEVDLKEDGDDSPDIIDDLDTKEDYELTSLGLLNDSPIINPQYKDKIGINSINESIEKGRSKSQNPAYVLPYSSYQAVNEF